ncbi:MAG: SGNH/GDSL hydrolase family protein [Flavobacteriales bacterium]|nr:SGNH/GDSL hydrolase family protein [Flavobacteriales bacterium]
MSTGRSALRKHRWWWIGGVALTLLLVEGGARLHLRYVLEKSPANKFRFNPYRVYEHVPGFSEDDRDGQVRMAINGSGFRRAREVLHEKPEGVCRIFLMGGSAAHGTSSAAPYPIRHVRNEETVDACLERMLLEAMPERRFEVINAAVTGYQVFQHTAYLQSELLDMDPDLVIFLDGHNDHYTSDAGHRYMLDYRYQFWTARLQEPGPMAVLDLACMAMARHSAAFRGFMAWRMARDAERARERSDLATMDGREEERLAAHRQRARDQFLRAVETNLYLLRRQDVKALVSLQPELVLREESMRSAEEVGFVRPDPAVLELYPLVAEELQAVCYAWNVPFIDMNPVFSSTRHKGAQLFIDYCHLTPAGGEVVAEALLPMVLALLAQEITPPGVAPAR